MPLPKSDLHEEYAVRIFGNQMEENQEKLFFPPRDALVESKHVVGLFEYTVKLLPRCP